MILSAYASNISKGNLYRMILCIAVICVTMNSIQSEVISVCEDGCNYTSINSGIDSAKSGDIVEIHSGIYRENVEISKQIILRGIDTGEGKPVVDAGRKGSAITLSADGIVLDGFVVKNAQGHPFIEWAGIKVKSNNNIISNSLATYNDNGIFFSGFENNTISGNNATRNVNGFRLERSNSNLLYFPSYSS